MKVGFSLGNRSKLPFGFRSQSGRHNSYGGSFKAAVRYARSFLSALTIAAYFSAIEVRDHPL
jgi:hypothetical protein